MFFIIIVIILTSLFKHPVGLSAFPCQWLIVGHGRQCYCVRCFSLFFSVHVYCCTSNILCCFIVFIIFFFQSFSILSKYFQSPVCPFSHSLHYFHLIFNVFRRFFAFFFCIESMLIFTSVCWGKVVWVGDGRVESRRKLESVHLCVGCVLTLRNVLVVIGCIWDYHKIKSVFKKISEKLL